MIFLRNDLNIYVYYNRYVLSDQWNEINIYHIYNVKPLVAIRIYILIVPYIVIILDLYFSSLLINHGFSSFIMIW